MKVISFPAYRTTCTILQVYSQLFLGRELKLSVRIKENNFTKIQESWNQTHAQFMETVEKVYNQSREIQAILMETRVGISLNLKQADYNHSVIPPVEATLANKQFNCSSIANNSSRSKAEQVSSKLVEKTFETFEII